MGTKRPKSWPRSYWMTPCLWWWAFIIFVRLRGHSNAKLWKFPPLTTLSGKGGPCPCLLPCLRVRVAGGTGRAGAIWPHSDFEDQTQYISLYDPIVLIWYSGHFCLVLPFCLLNFQILASFFQCCPSSRVCAVVWTGEAGYLAAWLFRESNAVHVIIWPQLPNAVHVI